MCDLKVHFTKIQVIDLSSHYKKCPILNGIGCISIPVEDIWSRESGDSIPNIKLILTETKQITMKRDTRKK